MLDGKGIEKLDWDELAHMELELLKSAEEALTKAYAPYSGFQVGAATRLIDGQVFTSNNQENVSFPIGVCAERSLLAYVGANFPETPPETLAIAAKRKGENEPAYVTPCGMCRQAVLETENRYKKAIKILLLMPGRKVVRISGIRELLPLSFNDLTN